MNNKKSVKRRKLPPKSAAKFWDINEPSYVVHVDCPHCENENRIYKEGTTSLPKKKRCYNCKKTFRITY